MSVADGARPVEPTPALPRTWRDLWWRILELRMGIVPVPVAIAVALLLTALLRTGDLPADLPFAIVVLATGGFLCGEIGRRLPLLRHLGAGAIFATFLPSFLVYAGALPEPLARSIKTFTMSSNVLYVFIAAIIVGSILGMDRRLLIGGFLKIVAPLALGSLAALGAGCAVGVALGLGFEHTLFKVVIPILAGGVGEGAVPLSIGYAHFSGVSQGEVFAEILPAVMLGNLAATVLAGGLNLLGRRVPRWSGDGRLQVGEQDVDIEHAPEAAVEATPQTVGAALVMVMTFYLMGVLAQRAWGWPGPVVMLGLTVACKLGRLASPELEAGAYANYRFFSACVTYPLLFAIGAAMTPWAKLVAAFNAPTVITIAATVTTLTVTGFVSARWLRMHPIEAAIVTTCRASQGGTGDVAILTAANRLQLMPFAQIATRIGGAITVTLGLIAFAQMRG